MSARIHQNFELRQGDERDVVITVYDPSGVLLDLTSAALTWVLMTSEWGEVLVTKTVSAGITISNQTTNKGEVTVQLNASDTATLEPRAYAHQLRAAQPAGPPELVTDGEVTLNRGAA